MKRMDEDDVLGGLNPVISENLREITNSLNEYANDKKSGVPEYKKKLEAMGFSVKVEISVNLTQGEDPESVSVKEPRSSDSKHPPSRADLKAAAEMGLSAADVESVEAQEFDAAYEAVLADIRAKAPKLVPRVRNWMCSYIEHTFPRLDIKAPGLEYLADSRRWSKRLEAIIKGLLTLPDAQKHLDTLLGHMNRLGHLPTNGLN